MPRWLQILRSSKPKALLSTCSQLDASVDVLTLNVLGITTIKSTFLTHRSHSIIKEVHIARTTTIHGETAEKMSQNKPTNDLTRPILKATHFPLDLVQYTLQ